MLMATKFSGNDIGELQFKAQTDCIGMERRFEGTWPKESGGSSGKDQDGGKGEWGITVSRRNI